MPKARWPARGRRGDRSSGQWPGLRLAQRPSPPLKPSLDKKDGAGKGRGGEGRGRPPPPAGHRVISESHPFPSPPAPAPAPLIHSANLYCAPTVCGPTASPTQETRRVKAALISWDSQSVRGTCQAMDGERREGPPGECTGVPGAAITNYDKPGGLNERNSFARFGEV